MFVLIDVSDNILISTTEIQHKSTYKSNWETIQGRLLHAFRSDIG